VIRLLIAILISLYTTNATASIEQQLLPNAKAVGDSPTLTYLFWDVYTATLYAPNGLFNDDQPFVLKLHYLRELKGKEIAKRSVEEIKLQGFNDNEQLQAWLKQMTNIFPNVSDGTELYGLRTKEGVSKFFKGSEFIGEINDPNFAKYFFSIWLGDKTSQPDMRKELLNLR
jgi:hypothetical protein